MAHLPCFYYLLAVFSDYSLYKQAKQMNLKEKLNVGKCYCK